MTWFDCGECPSSSGCENRCSKVSLAEFIARGLAAQRAVDVLNPATCAGCGCTDVQACLGGCSWLFVDRELKVGLCSNCGDQVDRYHAALTNAKTERNRLTTQGGHRS